MAPSNLTNIQAYTSPLNIACVFLLQHWLTTPVEGFKQKTKKHTPLNNNKTNLGERKYRISTTKYTSWADKDSQSERENGLSQFLLTLNIALCTPATGDLA